MGLDLVTILLVANLGSVAAPQPKSVGATVAQRLRVLGKQTARAAGRLDLGGKLGLSESRLLSSPSYRFGVNQRAAAKGARTFDLEAVDGAHASQASPELAKAKGHLDALTAAVGKKQGELTTAFSKEADPAKLAVAASALEADSPVKAAGQRLQGAVKSVTAAREQLARAERRSAAIQGSGGWKPAVGDEKLEVVKLRWALTVAEAQQDEARTQLVRLARARTAPPELFEHYEAARGSQASGTESLQALRSAAKGQKVVVDALAKPAGESDVTEVVAHAQPDTSAR